MKNKLNMLNKSSQNNLIYLTVSILFICLMLVTCGSDKDAGMVEFLCLDQSGAPIEKVAVTFNNKSQKSDDKGLCQFKVDVNPANLRLFVDASKQDYQFIGPDSVYLTRGELIKYALNFLNKQISFDAGDLTTTEKLAFNFIYPDTEDMKVVPEPVPEPVKTVEAEPEAPPAPRYASLQIESVPPGSRITIYDKRGRQVAAGRTSYKKDLPVGFYKIHVVSDLGYLTEDQNVNLTSNKSITINHRIIPVKIKIETEPEEAYVYLNGRKEYGSTPLKLELKKAGFHDLEIQKNGFETYKRKIEVQAGARDTTLFVKLKGLPHNFTIRLKEKGKVFIDGNIMNTAWQERIEIKGVTAGYHNIEIWYQIGNRKETHPKYFIKGIEGWLYEF